MKRPAGNLLIKFSGLFLSFVLFAGIIFCLPRILIVNEPPKKSDLIVILSGQHFKGRILHGVSLYKKGYAPKIVLSGLMEMEKETGISLGKIYLQSLGVPETAIILEQNSKTTFENAVYLQKILDQENDKSFILVTSPLHSFRSKLLFKSVISQKIQWSVSCDLNLINLHAWWKDVVTVREIFYECLSMPYGYFFRQ